MKGGHNSPLLSKDYNYELEEKGIRSNTKNKRRISIGSLQRSLEISPSIPFKKRYQHPDGVGPQRYKINMSAVMKSGIKSKFRMQGSDSKGRDLFGHESSRNNLSQ